MMASHAFAPLPAAALFPIGPALSAITRAPRAELEFLIERAIERLDAIDGDTDIEPNGDELDGGNGEDDFGPHNNILLGVGCPIADPDCSVDDFGCDDENDDREEEEPLAPDYGINQTVRSGGI
jgi:hypothetical protein